MVQSSRKEITEKELPLMLQDILFELIYRYHSPFFDLLLMWRAGRAAATAGWSAGSFYHAKGRAATSHPAQQLSEKLCDIFKIIGAVITDILNCNFGTTV